MPLPGWFTHAASFCIGAATAAAGVLANTHRDHDVNEDNSTGSKKVARSTNAGCMQVLPSLPIRIFQPNDNLVIAFDTRSKNPVFVMERMVLSEHNYNNSQSSSQSSASKSDNDTMGSSASSLRRNKRFREEQSLLPYHRSRNQNYRNSGYDRGHLAPAADFSYNEEAMNDTFVLTNVSPQLPKFNRSLWLRLEEFVRLTARKEEECTKQSNNETWVITGPLWLPASVTKRNESNYEESFQYTYEGIGKPPSLVAVPTHFYKVVAVIECRREPRKKNQSANNTTGGLAVENEDHNNSLTLKKLGAFVLPNSDTNNTGDNNGIRLVDYTVRITDLEAVTGLEFFPTLLGGTSTNNSNNSTNTTVANNNNDILPLQKEIADALTDDIRYRANKKGAEGSGDKQKNDTNAQLVPLSNNNSGHYFLSKGRQRKIQQVLRENSPLPFQHLCKKNDACYKFLRM